LDPSAGVPVTEVERRKQGYGSNAREKKPLRTVWQILCAVLDDFMLRVLLVAAVVTIIVNMIVEEEKSTG
jgi:magnesium-transporting ATPase (P-type)